MRGRQEMAYAQALSAALALEKQMYLALSEALDLTREVLDSLTRQDEVSVRLNLSLRQESIDRLVDCQAALKRQCGTLPAAECERLRRLLNGGEGGSEAAYRELAGQVARNRALWERVVQADQAVSQRLGGSRSFYRKQR